VETDGALDGEKSPVLRRLLLLIVLIKYLEDREVFPSGWFGRFCKGTRTFFDVLREGSPDDVRRLLDVLERRFNGDVFSLRQGPNASLTEERLRKFADLVEARTLKAQRYLWEQFSFKHLPVEVVSHLYQRFVKGGHGAVYTPLFLASLLLDRAMPYDKLDGRERVLDPACGSGVFLVGAFRRLINVWRSRNRWQPLDVNTLKAILERSIFGIELDPGAVDLAVFSLALAVCDTLKPNVIWRELRFDPLRGRNIIEGDFFSFVTSPQSDAFAAWPKQFDVVIGNPPFESKLSQAGQALNRTMEGERGELPDKQSAYLFLEQGLKSLRPGGSLCLIQPSGFLHNRRAVEFSQGIIRRHRVSDILDFVSIRGLYDGADPKTVAILAHSRQPAEDGWISHLTFRRTFSVSQRIGFELDHYDRHRVPQQLAETDPLVWRVNLLGGGRLQEVSERLRGLPTLADYVASKGWDYGEGFIAAKEGKREPAPFLTGKPLLPTGALTESGIDETKIGTLRETHFASARNQGRFSAPLVLIKEHDSLPMAFWDKGFLAYRHKIVGIHAEPSDRGALEALYGSLRQSHHIHRFCSALNGSQALVGKATAILKQDIDALPCPDDPSELRFSFWEEALREDVLDYMAEFIRLGQGSALLREAAGKKELAAYAEMFCRMLGSVYDNLKAHDPIVLDGLIYQPFYFGERPNSKRLGRGSAKELRKLVYDVSHESLRTVRLVRFYLENVILIVKPDRLRYWIRSTAIRDADETLTDLRQEGF